MNYKMNKLLKEPSQRQLKIGEEIKHLLSQQLIRKETHIKELDELGQDERKQLSKMAKQNNVANNLQILKEVATFRSEREVRRNTEKNFDLLTTNVANQKKHNKGAAKSRLKIEEQNEQILKLNHCP